MKFLVVDDEEDIRDLIGFAIESYVKVGYQFADSGNAAINELKKDSNYIGIICDYNMPNGNGAVVYSYLLENKLNIPFILCSSDPPQKYPIFKSGPMRGFIEKPFILEGIKSLVSAIASEAMSSEEVSESLLNEESHIRIKISLLYLINILPCDIYIRLSDQKYIKVFQAGSVFADEEKNKYEQKDIEFLFIKSGDLKVFYDKLLLQYGNEHKLNTLKTEDSQITLNLQATIQDIGSSMGFTPELEKMSKMSVDSALKTINMNPTLSKLVSSMKSSSGGDYLVNHAVQLATVSTAMAQMTAWGSEQTLYKLSLASLLHDITLKNSKIAEIESLEELQNRKAEFTEEEIKSYQEHPRKAAELVSRFSEVPPDVDTIIWQHHERIDGSGFPQHLNQLRIAPLAALLIIAHDYVRCYQKSQKDLKKFVEDRVDFYNLGYFKKIINSIIDYLSENTTN